MAIYAETPGKPPVCIDHLDDATAASLLSGAAVVHHVTYDLAASRHYVAASGTWRHGGQDIAAPDHIEDEKGRKWMPKGGVGAWRKG